MTSNGYKPIEKIKIGDKVLSRDESGSDIDYKAVVETFKNWHDADTRSIVIKNEIGGRLTINTTDEHPFYVDLKGWVNANNILLGDKIVTDDENVKLEVVANDSSDRNYFACDLTVDDFHTYFVSNKNLLVHNCSSKSSAPKAEVERQKNIAKGHPDSTLGPSGKTKFHNSDSKTLKAAKDGAQKQAGKGTVIKDSANPKQAAHLHAVKQNGQRVGDKKAAKSSLNKKTHFNKRGEKPTN